MLGNAARPGAAHPWTQSLQPPLFHLIRDLRSVDSSLPPNDPDLAARMHARAGHISELRGWPPRTLRSVRRGLRVLAITHLPGEPIHASTVAQLTHTAVPAHHVLHVLTGTDLLVDDRRDTLVSWWDSTVAGLPARVIVELDVWLEVLRRGTTRQRPRARSTITTNLNAILPFLRAHPDYSTLRQVTNAALRSWLSTRHDNARPATALRSLFEVLKSRQLIFTNPMRGIIAGTNRVSVPLPLTTTERAAITHATSDNPALGVVIALAGIHALTSSKIRSLTVGQVDLHGHRLHVDANTSHPLDGTTATAVARYLDFRRQRWPHTGNPHLLLTRNTATTTTAASSGWLDSLLRGLPVATRRLREDRILDEAAATGDDALHLAHVFKLGSRASLRYTAGPGN